ncbi:MAG: alpha/beta fold hydrolase [Gammaproteobacteria bacterium]|nr:alpha/beta fold hydrolase [Gammaproteobacteria bacterium]
MPEYSPPRLLRSAHVQSVLAGLPTREFALLRRCAPALAGTVRETIDVGGGVRLYADITPPARPGRMVILLHGWEGSSGSQYMVSVAARLARAGFRVVRLNFRDHGDSHHLNREIFHSCRLDEVLGAVRVLATRWQGERICLGGFSLGGNFAMRIAAAAPDAGVELARVVAVCPVLDPRETMAALEAGPYLYQLYFLRKWRHSLVLKQRAFADVYDFGDLNRFTSLREMTDYFVRGYTDFPDLDTYLRGYAITGDRLARLEVPAEILLAEDDPVIPVTGATALARPRSLTLRRSRHGGHVSFLADYRLRSWLDDYVAERFA